MLEGLIIPCKAGTRQGVPLPPLLGNIYLHALETKAYQE
jgi:hypothetical protein